MSDDIVEVVVTTTYRINAVDWRDDIVLGSKSVYEFDVSDQIVEVVK